MEKEEGLPRKFKSLSDFHRTLGQVMPFHPMVSLIDIGVNHIDPDESFSLFMTDFYQIIYKPDMQGKARYGQNYYDFAEGGLIFSAPHQIFEAPPRSTKKRATAANTGWWAATGMAWWYSQHDGDYRNGCSPTHCPK